MMKAEKRRTHKKALQSLLYTLKVYYKYFGILKISKSSRKNTATGDTKALQVEKFWNFPHIFIWEEATYNAITVPENLILLKQNSKKPTQTA